MMEVTAFEALDEHLPVISIRTAVQIKITKFFVIQFARLHPKAIPTVLPVFDDLMGDEVSSWFNVLSCTF
jgi:hypothetical protein